MSSPDHLVRLVNAITQLEETAGDSVERSREIQRRARHFRRRIEVGDRLIDLVENDEPPPIVELLSSNLASLETAGAEFRATQAKALREEGLTIEAIAQLFGVTRQRISALLKQRAAQVGGQAPRH